MKRGVAILVTCATGTVTIIESVGIALVVVVLLVQSASATTDLMTETLAGVQEASKTTTPTLLDMH